MNLRGVRRMWKDWIEERAGPTEANAVLVNEISKIK